MTEHEHRLNVAATWVWSTATVLHESWPEIQDDTDIRQFVMLLGRMCDALDHGDPPAAAKWYGMILEQYTAYAGGGS